MIISNAPQNEAVVSNVGGIGEFRIRNSAKAFSILSSGLYANKIRAIIRELSCNAVDSHVAAGKKGTPFDVHLPNVLEPWFSIRDYGTGLSHDQVVNIYTTYFESTKTASNEFIGALGLGSKSPFAYTDNFSVIAVKDGVKGIYTAFINEQGVPSIALMTSENTTDPNGVEVKFSVNDRPDFERFRSEATKVYTYFKDRPVISGVADFKFVDPVYADKDIVPGVHTLANANSHSSSIAIMGNIAYPVQVPEADKTLGKLKSMLDCGLVMEFNIGELDFQASREGLSYVPQTIESIKKKLEQLNDQLVIHIKEEADKIENNWERAYYLNNRSASYLWRSAVEKYATDTKFTNYKSSYGGHYYYQLDEEELKNNYNIIIRQFSKSSYNVACENRKHSINHQTTPMTYYWNVSVEQATHFIVNDTKIGATERAKYHYRKDKKNLLGNHTVTVTVIEPADRTKPVKIDEFFANIGNPPESQIFKASSLDQKERATGIGKNVTIMQLERRSRGYRSVNYVWSDAGKMDGFDDSNTYYYLPLSGYQNLGKVADVNQLKIDLVNSGIYTGNIYGVRKGDMETVKAKKNWINLDDYVTEQLKKLDATNIMGMVKEVIDLGNYFKYNVCNKVRQDSPYFKFVSQFNDVTAVNREKHYGLERLCHAYKVSKAKVDPSAMIQKYKEEAKVIKQRYPLIDSAGYATNMQDIADYVNAIDQLKGI